MLRATVVAIIGLVVAAGLAAGYTFQWGAPTEQGVPGGMYNETTTNTTAAPMAGGHGPKGGPMAGGAMPMMNHTIGHTEENCTHNGTTPGGPGGHGMNMTHPDMGAEAVCNSIGNMTIRDSIQWLLDYHYLFNYTVEVYEDNMSIVWVITSENKTALEVLYYHILQMECVLENGGTPRPQDPLFVLDAQVSPYVQTNVTFINETAIKVVKVAENDCAFQVIKLHAEVIKGFFEQGRIEADTIHPVPDDILQVCEPYINQTATP